MVLNEVHGGASAYVLATDLTGGAVAVTATDNASITATTDATASASGGSVFGTAPDDPASTALAINSTITTNEVVGSADAHILDSSVITNTGDVSVVATNSDTIAATTKSAVTVGGSGGGNAVGILMAFNSIGATVNNLLSLSVDAIAADNVLGTSSPATTTAYIKDSNVSSHGALTVAATSTEIITATLGNDTTSDAVAFVSAGGLTASATIGSNQVNATVTAYVDNGNSTGLLPANAQVTSVGAMSVNAIDSASITASSEMTSINTPVNDGGAGLINHYGDLVLNAYQYTEKSGTQTLNFGDKVWVGNGDGTGTIYRWMGTTQSLNLGSPDVRLHQSRILEATVAVGGGPGSRDRHHRRGGGRGAQQKGPDRRDAQSLSAVRLQQRRQLRLELRGECDHFLGEPYGPSLGYRVDHRR